MSHAGAHGGQRYSYHENPAHRYSDQPHDFSSLPRDHRFTAWKRPPPARRADIDGMEAVRGHRRSFHYDDRKEYYTAAGTKAGAPNASAVVTAAMKREISPAAARRSYDPSLFEPCDR